MASPVHSRPAGPEHGSPTAEEALPILIGAVQELSMAPTLADVQRVVRTAARRLVGADGATFVLRDTDKCFYADEDARSGRCGRASASRSRPASAAGPCSTGSTW